MALTRFRRGRLDALEIDAPVPQPNQVLIRVLACGVCRTDLHVIDGELPETVSPLSHKSPSIKDARSMLLQHRAMTKHCVWHAKLGRRGLDAQINRRPDRSTVL
jgi:threonine dehydrogenase-like Zn-dependent dehydrogenase